MLKFDSQNTSDPRTGFPGHLAHTMYAITQVDGIVSSPMTRASERSMKMGYTSKEGRQTRSSGFGPPSPRFKLIQVRPVERSVATGSPVSTNRNLVFLTHHWWPSPTLSSIAERKAKRNAGFV